jgi:parvulin-like peptidyl-prolyl isomerase
MKKLLTLSMLLASIAFTAFSTEAKTTAANNVAAPQVRIQLGQNRRNNRRYNRAVRVVTQTRNVRVGRQVYRETYQTRYMPNGRVVTRLISRVRIR